MPSEKLDLQIKNNECMGESRGNYNMWYQYLIAQILDKSSLIALSQYHAFDLTYDLGLLLINGYLDYQIREGLKIVSEVMFFALESYQLDDTKE
ncbi:hypothetical protein SAMN06265171_105244 [Chryseobacterium rhizoplanae]|uniref:Uncharacterized protein n=2 Tax=Chryseobacterium rhizoplanae TaxID=1609531 RepID=A0A521DLG0_9FLAO|nr:hypothetical protein SAMN06265171_105244 [Chryseobacterium rhizoplanae]